MNHWTLIIRRKLGNNLARPEPENKVDKYAVAVTKDAQVFGQLKKGRIGRYAKTVFFFLLANPMNIASITVTWKRVNFRDGQDFQIPWTILFKAKDILKLKKKTVELMPFITVYMLEILSVKDKEYQYYH